MGVNTWDATVGNRIDWQAERERVDLAAVVTGLLGPAAGRRGEKGRRLWWSCPFHEDPNPSLCVDPGQEWWRCFGCGAKGDAATMVMRLEGVSFPEALKLLVGGQEFRRTVKPRPASKSVPTVRPEPMGPEILELVVEAERRLWTPEGAGELAYLVGRGLTEATIRAARLGVTGMGITIPWFDGPDLRMVNVRRPDGSDPRYMALRGSHRGGLYPGPQALVAGLPVVIVEGEIDRLLLAQELVDLASVVTLGGASESPTSALREAMLPAWPWYVATDADEAGDKAADRWPASARRVRPPGVFKDWGEAHSGGLGLRRWWSALLAGDEAPPLFTWEELSTLRWDSAVGDSTPGIDVPHDWRSAVAGWPHGRWSRWRALSGELLAGQDDEPPALDIKMSGPAFTMVSVRSTTVHTSGMRS